MPSFNPRGDGDAVDTPPTLDCGREADDIKRVVANQIADNWYLLVELRECAPGRWWCCVWRCEVQCTDDPDKDLSFGGAKTRADKNGERAEMAPQYSDLREKGKIRWGESSFQF
jgi:hypothetical protein